MDGGDDRGKKPSEKKNAPQANNLVWYLLGLGIVLLLLATVWSGQERLKIGWSDLKRLVQAAHLERRDRQGTHNYQNGGRKIRTVGRKAHRHQNRPHRSDRQGGSKEAP